MARVLVIGAAGLLGREIVRAALAAGNDVIPTGRAASPGWHRFDAELDEVEGLLDEAPALVVNCAALLASDLEPGDAATAARAERVNAWFPHALAEASESHDARMIHISTDAVFRADAGICLEDDDDFTNEVYGRTKRDGEPDLSNTLTLRCSFIGLDPARHRGLLEWLLAQPPETEVIGYVDQLWNGLVSTQVAGVCALLADPAVFDSARAEGPVHHLSQAPTLTKHELVEQCVETFALPLAVGPSPSGRPSTRLLETRHSTLAQCLECLPARAPSLDSIAERWLHGDG